MKIAVFGWYGHDNAGDERIKYCLQSFLLDQGGIDCVDFYDLHENAIKGATSQFDVYDLVIIGGGGLILSQSNYHDFIRNINTKIITLGISVERPKLTGNAKKFAMALLDKSFRVLVRDPDSAQKLLPYDNHKKVKVSSDLTFLKPYNAVNLSKDNKIGINLLPKPIDFKYSTLSSSLFSPFLRQLTRFGFEKIIRISDYQDIIQELKQKFYLLPIPLYCSPQEKNTPMYQKNDVEYLKKYFNDVATVFSDHYLDACTLFISMRLHGAIFAVQKGIPVLSFSYLPKNRNFMRDVGLEDCVLDSPTPKNTFSCIDNIIRNQSDIRDKMSVYTEKSTAKISKDVLEILNLIFI